MAALDVGRAFRARFKGRFHRHQLIAVVEDAPGDAAAQRLGLDTIMVRYDALHTPFPPMRF